MHPTGNIFISQVVEIRALQSKETVNNDIDFGGGERERDVQKREEEGVLVEYIVYGWAVEVQIEMHIEANVRKAGEKHR